VVSALLPAAVLENGGGRGPSTLSTKQVEGAEREENHDLFPLESNTKGAFQKSTG
jgi:hypothetical protein